MGPVSTKESGIEDRLCNLEKNLSTLVTIFSTNLAVKPDQPTPSTKPQETKSPARDKLRLFNNDDDVLELPNAAKLQNVVGSIIDNNEYFTAELKPEQSVKV